MPSMSARDTASPYNSSRLSRDSKGGVMGGGWWGGIVNNNDDKNGKNNDDDKDNVRAIRTIVTNNEDERV